MLCKSGLLLPYDQRIISLIISRTLLRRCPKPQQAIYFERVLEIRRQIRAWWTTLPSITAFKEISPTSSQFRPVVHLKLCFFLNEIFMGRPFIFFDFKIVSPGASGNSATNHPSPTPSSPSARATNRAVLASDAVTAALEIIDLCRMLNEYCGLARASYTEFSSCRAALLVILAQSLNEKTEALRNSLALGMRLIKKMASSFHSSRSELSVIEALETAIRRLDRAATSGKDYREANDAILSGYDRFKSWAMLWSGDQDTPTAPPVPFEQIPQEIRTDALAGHSLARESMTANKLTDNTQAIMHDMVPVETQATSFGIDEAFSTFPMQAGDMTNYEWQMGFVGVDVSGMGLDVPSEFH